MFSDAFHFQQAPSYILLRTHQHQTLQISNQSSTFAASLYVDNAYTLSLEWLHVMIQLGLVHFVGFIKIRHHTSIIPPSCPTYLSTNSNKESGSLNTAPRYTSKTKLTGGYAQHPRPDDRLYQVEYLVGDRCRSGASAAADIGTTFITGFLRQGRGNIGHLQCWKR